MRSPVTKKLSTYLQRKWDYMFVCQSNYEQLLKYMRIFENAILFIWLTVPG